MAGVCRGDEVGLSGHHMDMVVAQLLDIFCFFKSRFWCMVTMLSCMWQDGCVAWVLSGHLLADCQGGALSVATCHHGS
jgi:hypothetical protein